MFPRNAVKALWQWILAAAVVVLMVLMHVQQGIAAEAGPQDAAPKPAVGPAESGTKVQYRGGEHGGTLKASGRVAHPELNDESRRATAMSQRKEERLSAIV